MGARSSVVRPVGPVSYEGKLEVWAGCQGAAAGVVFVFSASLVGTDLVVVITCQSQTESDRNAFSKASETLRALD